MMRSRERSYKLDGRPRYIYNCGYRPEGLSFHCGEKSSSGTGEGML